MQFAEVAVKTKVGKIDQTFSYSIPSSILAEVKKGILVEVPFHGRKLPGIVLDLKRNVNLKYKLKPISKIVCPSPILDNSQSKLAKWISDYYLAPIGEVVFTMIPPIAHRLVKSIGKILFKKAMAKLDGKKKIVYTLYDRISNRIKDYIKITKKALGQNKQVIILFPEINLSSDNLKSFFQVFSPAEITILHANLTRTQRYQAWLSIRTGKKKIIIGSRSAIFAPCSNLGLIIIDQPENFAYKGEQTPKYHSVTVAKKLSELTDASLVLGSSSPSLENFYWENRGKYQKVKSEKLKARSATMELVDMRQEKSIISWKLEQEIGDTLHKKNKVLLFVSKRGYASAFLCKDCGYTFRCPRCSNALTHHAINPPSLICHHCNFQSALPLTCPNCRGANLKSLGFGTEIIESKVKKLFPQAKIILIDKDTLTILNFKFQIKNYDIVIATKSILQTSQSFDLTAVVSLDYMLNLPDIYSSENTYFTIVDLINITEKRLIIQTHQPDNNLFYLLANHRIDQFLKNELSHRKQYHYPPFGLLIKIISKSKDINQSKKELSRFSNLLNDRLHKEKLNVEMSQPAPSYLSKKRNKYYYQIIIKSKDSKIKKIIKNINIPKNLIIDVDPISLL